MSNNIQTTTKWWGDVPTEMRAEIATIIEGIQQQLLSHFDVITVEDAIVDENDNGDFPLIDLEVLVQGDPEGVTRRLVVTIQKEDDQ